MTGRAICRAIRRMIDQMIGRMIDRMIDRMNGTVIDPVIAAAAMMLREGPRRMKRQLSLRMGPVQG